jgi:hypothetical protein
MPEDEDIMGEHGKAAEHTAFVAAQRFNFGLSWAGAICMNCRANPRGPTLPVSTIKPSRIMIFNPSTGQIIICTQPEPPWPTAPPALTQQQLQWLEEDLHEETPISTLPPYCSTATTVVADDDDIPALTLVLEDHEHEQTPLPMPSIHPGMGWFHNANEETRSPIFRKYVIEDSLKIVAPYY